MKTTIWMVLGAFVALTLSTGAMADSSTTGPDDFDYLIARCDLYQGSYSANKTPIYSLNIEDGEFVMPQINISHDSAGVQTVFYWAGMMLDFQTNQSLLEIRDVTHNVEVQTPLVAGQPAEVMLQDPNSNTTLRCFTPSAHPFSP